MEGILFDTPASTLMGLATLACATIALSMVLTRLMLWLLPRWGMMDKPDFKRHIHKRAVPRGGGLGMLLAFTGVSTAFFGLLCRGCGNAPAEMQRLLVPLVILLPLGLVDDRFGLSARTKFIFQMLAALLAWWLGFRMNSCFGAHFPSWLGCLVTVFWIVAFINAFNMIDGVDGLASGIGFISAVCLAITAFVNKHSYLGMLLVIFGSSLLGFLYYNWHPARLFMGDTGSMFIGYILAVSGLCISARAISVASIGIPLLACGLPVLDIFLAVWRRIVGTPPSSLNTAEEEQEPADAAAQSSLLGRLVSLAGRLGTADQSHIHHRLLRHFHNNQRKTIYSLYALALGMGIVGIVCSFLPNRNLLLALVVIIGTFSFIINRLAFIELWNTTETLYHGFQSAHTGLLFSYVINPIWDLVCILAAYHVAARGYPLGAFTMLRYAGILMIVLCCSRPYRVFWNFAASDDYYHLGCALLFGFLLARGSDLFFRISHINRIHSYAAGVAITLILMERLFLHYFRNAQIRRHANVSLADGAKPVLTLIVGVTPMARLYRNLLASDMERAAREEIVGIVALDRHFVHSYCYGMRVLGYMDDLEYIVEHYKIGKIVVTRNLSETEIQLLRGNCRKFKAILTSFSCQETTMEIE